ncbi:MAG: peptidoglycan DD-metalloendopeptidase family protein [Gemmatimonadaceae bacterium]|nr:peptidoglycan DD-metalloendopeptidase family protein [Gemmatimonadaceae bacterium]
MRHGAWIALGVCAAIGHAQQPPAPTPAPVPSAERLRQQRDELERVRNERNQLQQQMQRIQGQVHSLSEEVTNLDRQADATARVVKSLDLQLTSLGEEVDNASASLVLAQDELVIKRALLGRRVREIYKRGPLYSLEALLSAQSFGALVARYKYLHLAAQRDRVLVHRVETLNEQIGGHRTQLVRLRTDMELSREERAAEERRLRELEGVRGRSLQAAQREQTRTAARLAAIQRDEQRLSTLIASADAERRRVEGRPNAGPASISTLRTTDLGRLAWPVDGTILYRFGRAINPNNTTIRWNGVGIGAIAGTPVRSVADGAVVVAENVGTYGLTVILQHGGGDYSVYGSLARADVKKGQKVTKGQTLGTVGRADPDMEPHLHFEIRPRGRAVDPLDWLRQQPR